jgi:hypothetical protein
MNRRFLRKTAASGSEHPFYFVARLVRGDFFFFYSKFRIAGWQNKTANFVGWEAMIYQWLLLWISGGKLTKMHEYRVQASRRPLAATRFTSSSVTHSCQFAGAGSC